MSLRRLATLVALGLAAVGCAGSSADVTDASPSVLTTMVAPDATAAASPEEAADSTAAASGNVLEQTAEPVGTQPRFSDLPAISVDDLPDEAIDTLFLIDEGGPFPYDQDGSTFQNRERILPQQPRGHYREYTVETPGSDDRGARRIVAGDDGELYWTDDHYDSFSEIVDWRDEP